MKRGTLIIILLIWGLSGSAQQLIEEQLRYERVRDAKQDYEEALEELFRSRGISYPPADIYLRAFKFDKEMELWALNGAEYVWVKTYDICSVSGELGPKSRRGDSQIPEGVYHLEAFNPVSSYHLSMKVNYPNPADRLRGYAPDLGGDIFIHGDCVTIGCIPIENEPIKELYWLSVRTKEQGGKLPVHVFPFRMDKASLRFFERLPLFQPEDWAFWKQLIPIYNFFETHHKIPVISVASDGRYVLSKKKNLVNN